MIAFETLTPPTSPNYYLVCPSHYCAATPHKTSPVYPVPLDKLETSWFELMKQQPRLTQLKSKPEKHHYEYQQRSMVFRFPDVIVVEFIPVDSNHSTLAIYSYAKYGYSDFGVNRRRVMRWLDKVSLMISP